jgi:hypothetical protein
MSPGERKLAAHLLRLASDQFSNHICNDFDLSEFCADQEARDAFVRSYHEWNGDLAEMEENGWLDRSGSPDYRLMDFALMDFLADRLENDD